MPPKRENNDGAGEALHEPGAAPPGSSFWKQVDAAWRAGDNTSKIRVRIKLLALPAEEAKEGEDAGTGATGGSHEAAKEGQKPKGGQTLAYLENTLDYDQAWFLREVVIKKNRDLVGVDPKLKAEAASKGWLKPEPRFIYKDEDDEEYAGGSVGKKRKRGKKEAEVSAAAAIASAGASAAQAPSTASFTSPAQLQGVGLSPEDLALASGAAHPLLFSPAAGATFSSLSASAGSLLATSGEAQAALNKVAADYGALSKYRCSVRSEGDAKAVTAAEETAAQLNARRQAALAVLASQLPATASSSLAPLDPEAQARLFVDRFYKPFLTIAEEESRTLFPGLVASALPQQLRDHLLLLRANLALAERTFASLDRLRAAAYEDARKAANEVLLLLGKEKDKGKGKGKGNEKEKEKGKK